MVISQVLAWVSALLCALEVLRYPARASRAKGLNRAFHKIHIPLGVLLLLTGCLHGLLAGNLPAAALGDAIPWEIVPDRREAIFRALSLAGKGDVVALLGKGHEEYIEENGVRRPFSERAVVEELLSPHEAVEEVTDGLDQQAAALEGVKLAHNDLS